MKSWFCKYCQSKGMPLPFGYSIPPYEDAGGLSRVDVRMPKNVAKDEERKHPRMDYLGSGGYAVAYDDQGSVVKYTRDPADAVTSNNIRKRPVPCAVKVFSVERLPQGVFKIVSEKVRTLNQQEMNNFYTEGKKEFQDRQQMVQCLVEHGIHPYDIYDQNVGYNSEGRMVLLDLGKTSLKPRN